jgi:transketolase
MQVVSNDLIERSRRRLLRMHFESGVGHIGGNLSCLEALLVVFHEHLGAGDSFILSKGHSAGALYVTLWTLGRIEDDALATFHRDGTLLPGHPPCNGLPDIPFATGSLGHGLSLAAGTALGERLQGRASNVVCLTSDGEWQEGSTWEALIFACHHRLSNLTVLIDHNGLQGFGSTQDVASMSPLWQRLQGFDLDLEVIDGHDPVIIGQSLKRPSQGKLRVLVLKTVKGHGVPFMEGRMEWHYLPLTAELFAQSQLPGGSE